MIDLLKSFFGKITEMKPGGEEKETSHDVCVATCALFLEMAYIDGEFSHSERENIIAILKKHFCLSDEYIAELLKASNDELKRSIDLWQFTNLINQNYSMDEKVQIIEMIWKIVYSDRKLDKHEDYLVHKLARLLHLTHTQLIDAKLKVLQGS